MKGAFLECRNQLADFRVIFEWLPPISLTLKRVFRAVIRLLSQAGSLCRGLVRSDSQTRLVSRRGVSMQDTFLYRFVDLRNGHRQLRADVPGIAAGQSRPQLLDRCSQLGAITSIDNPSSLTLPHPLFC